MSITIKGGIYYDASSMMYGEQPRFVFFTGELRQFQSYQPVVAHTIEFALPDGFSAEGAAIAALERQRDELRAKFADDVRRVNEQIGKLQALTNEVQS